MKRTITIILFLFCYELVVCQNKLLDIEKRFEREGIVINPAIGDSIIMNDFPDHKRINALPFSDCQMKIDLSKKRELKRVNYYKYRFKDSVQFNNMHFEDVLDVSLSRFATFVSFHQSQFDKEVFFPWVQFDKKAIFSLLEFKKNAFFTYAIFHNSDFFETRFHENVDFYACQFKGDCSFSNVSFNKVADFSFSKMDGEINFKGVKLFKTGLFRETRINSSLDFSDGYFDTLLDLSGSSVAGKLIFNNATLPYHLDLSGIESLNTIVDLTQCKPNALHKVCLINLVNTDASKVKFQYDNFLLWFPPNTSYAAKCRVYDGVLNAFKTFGFETSYEKLDIEYMQFKYEHHNQYIKNNIQKIWWNYGYKKEKIFDWLFRIVVILTIINTLFIRSLMGSIYEIKYLDYSKVEERHQLYHPILTFFLNIPTGFLYTTILVIGGAFGIKFNSDQIRLPSFLGMLYIIFIGVLGISCSAFILNLIFDF